MDPLKTPNNCVSQVNMEDVCSKLSCLRAVDDGVKERIVASSRSGSLPSPKGRPKGISITKRQLFSHRPIQGAGTDPLKTPNNCVSQVNMEDVCSKLSCLRAVDDASSRSGSLPSPKGRPKGISITKRQLFSHRPIQGVRTPVPWSLHEDKALVSFLLLYTDGSSWPSQKDCLFWKRAGEFVQSFVQSSHCRTG